jgi:hypothetical protein
MTIYIPIDWARADTAFGREAHTAPHFNERIHADLRDRLAACGGSDRRTLIASGLRELDREWAGCSRIGAMGSLGGASNCFQPGARSGSGDSFSPRLWSMVHLPVIVPGHGITAVVR